MEMLDVLNENGEPTGVVKARGMVHRDGDLHRTVHVWLLNSRKEVLLQKRAADKKTHPGLWDMACAGHIAHGETSLETAGKEFAEELGILIPLSDIRYVFSIRSRHVHRGGRITDNELHDVYLVRKDIPLSDFKIQKEEVEDVAYLPFDDFCRKAAGKDLSLVPHFEEFEAMCRHLSRLLSGKSNTSP